MITRPLPWCCAADSELLYGSALNSSSCDRDRSYRSRDLRRRAARLHQRTKQPCQYGWRRHRAAGRPFAIVLDNESFRRRSPGTHHRRLLSDFRLVPVGERSGRPRRCSSRRRHIEGPGRDSIDAGTAPCFWTELLAVIISCFLGDLPFVRGHAVVSTRRRHPVVTTPH